MSSRLPPVRLTLVTLAALGAMVAGACGSDDDGGGGRAASGGDLAGTQWLLDTGDLGVQGAADVSSFLRFERTRVSGNDGCNQFTGSYEADGSKLTFGTLAGTQIACTGPADAVSRKVGAALPRVASYSISGDSLRLMANSGELLLTYGATTRGVEGSWEAISVLYDDAIRSVITGTKLTAGFGSDDRLSGSGGCNTFNGPYSYDGETLSIGPLASTKKACASPEGVAEQEQGYFAALESAVRIDQVGDGLTLFNTEGQMAVTFKRR